MCVFILISNYFIFTVCPRGSPLVNLMASQCHVALSFVPLLFISWFILVFTLVFFLFLLCLIIFFLISSYWPSFLYIYIFFLGSSSLRVVGFVWAVGGASPPWSVLCPVYPSAFVFAVILISSFSWLICFFILHFCSYLLSYFIFTLSYHHCTIIYSYYTCCLGWCNSVTFSSAPFFRALFITDFCFYLLVLLFCAIYTSVFFIVYYYYFLAYY